MKKQKKISYSRALRSIRTTKVKIANTFSAMAVNRKYNQTAFIFKSREVRIANSLKKKYHIEPITIEDSWPLVIAMCSINKPPIIVDCGLGDLLIITESAELMTWARLAMVVPARLAVRVDLFGNVLGVFVSMCDNYDFSQEYKLQYTVMQWKKEHT